MPVLEGAVVEQLLAVIGGEDHEQALAEGLARERVEQAREREIDAEQLLVVSALDEAALRRALAHLLRRQRGDACEGQMKRTRVTGGEATAHLARWIVGRVRRHQMQQQEKRALIATRQPMQRRFDHPVRARRRSEAAEQIPIGLEAARHAEARMQEGILDQRGRHEAIRAQRFREHRQLRRQRRVIRLRPGAEPRARAVLRRSQARIDRSEARERPRRARECALEHGPLRGAGIERG